MDKSPELKTLLHALEVSVVALVSLGVLYLASRLAPEIRSELLSPVSLIVSTTLLSMIPKYARSHPSIPVKDIVNE